MTTIICCAECGKERGVSLKACKSCMLVKYCNPSCQRNHWSTHKTACKQRAAEIRDEALFKDPPAKEDCFICFLPMPAKLISCISLPPATISSVPVYDFAIAAHETLQKANMALCYECCGKTMCGGCIHSFGTSRNMNCPYCKSVRGKTEVETIGELMMRVEANDADAIYALGSFYYHGSGGLLQDREKAMELLTRAAALGSCQAHFQLGIIYNGGGNLKKAKFHYEAAAMAGHEVARCNLGCFEAETDNMGRAVKHWITAASAGEQNSMHNLLVAFNQGSVNRNTIDSSLTAYNNSCAEMRSEARDAYILGLRTRLR